MVARQRGRSMRRQRQEIIIDRDLMETLIDAADEGVALNARQFYTAKHKAWRERAERAIKQARELLENGT